MNFKTLLTINLVIIILINGMGCSTYNPIKIEDTDKNKEIKKAQITTIDDKLYFLTDVTIEGNKIKGSTSSTHSEWLRGNQREEIVIPLEEIKEFKLRECDKTLTLGLIILSGGIFALILTLSKFTITSTSNYGF